MTITRLAGAHYRNTTSVPFEALPVALLLSGALLLVEGALAQA